MKKVRLKPVKVFWLNDFSEIEKVDPIVVETTPVSTDLIRMFKDTLQTLVLLGSGAEHILSKLEKMK